MLSEIRIQNFAIVESLTIELTPGMSVLTGETGAGKSILLDALNLALGGRADTGAIRAGCERAEIITSFNLSRQKYIVQWLKEHELNDNSDCTIRRTINSDGRSKGYVNGYVVPMQSLRELGDMLVDIHGQHAHQSLLKKEVQRLTLDDFSSHGKLLEEVNQAYLHWKTLKKQQQDLEKNRSEREARIDLLSYQTEELSALDLTAEDIDSIDSEYAKLSHANQIREGVEKILYVLNDNEETAVTNILNKSLRDLEELQQYDEKLQTCVSLLSEITIQSSETVNELRHYIDNLSVDPQQLEWLNERLAILHDLSRKHHVDSKALPELLNTLSEELAQLQNTQDQSGNLDALLSQAETAYFEAANKLSDSRKKHAARLEKSVTGNLQQLGMKDGRFKVDIQPVDDIALNGLERVEFLVNMNPGQAFKPMSKVASGGELSRISLALQVIIANKGRIPCLIFDEVDVGIGGGIAEVVGLKLRELSTNRQVICVTHQPQVASLAHNHLHVSKSSDKQSTQTEVMQLNQEQRQQEIARMLGGLKITEQTLSHAKEMIDRGQVELAD